MYGPCLFVFQESEDVAVVLICVCVASWMEVRMAYCIRLRKKKKKCDGLNSNSIPKPNSTQQHDGNYVESVDAPQDEVHDDVIR